MLTDYRILFLFIVPVVMSLVFLRHFQREFHWLEAIASFVLFCVVVTASWYIGRDMRISSYTEQIGGFVTSHYAEDGDHQESYSCNCTTDSDGNSSCDTCWRTVYHRDFIVKTNIGDWFPGSKWEKRVDKPSKDRGPRSIPQFYLDTYLGKPVSLDNQYPNYIAASNESVYRNTYHGLLASGIPDICPANPDIRANEASVWRIFPVGFDSNAPLRSEIYNWNFSPSPVDLNTLNIQTVPLYGDSLFGYLGGEVQADVHLYVFNSPNLNYAPMCLAKWNNAAKNSINVFIFGSSDGISYSASDVYVGLGVDGAKKNSELNFEDESGRSNYYMKFDIRNQLLDYFKNGGTLNRESVLRIIADNVYSKFVRQEMAEFKALKNFVHPTNSFMLLIAVLLVIADFFLHLYFIQNDF